MTGFTLGQQVEFDNLAVLYRTGAGTGRKAWQDSTQLAGAVPPNPKRGIVVGVRTLANGTIEGGWDEPITFYPTEHFTAYLVAYDLRRKPVLLRRENLRPLEGASR